MSQVFLHYQSRVGHSIILLKNCQAMMVMQEWHSNGLQHIFLVDCCCDPTLEHMQRCPVVTAHSAPHHETASTPAVGFQDTVHSHLLFLSVPNTNLPIHLVKTKLTFISEQYSAPSCSCPFHIFLCPCQLLKAMLRCQNRWINKWVACGESCSCKLLLHSLAADLSLLSSSLCNRHKTVSQVHLEKLAILCHSGHT